MANDTTMKVTKKSYVKPIGKKLGKEECQLTTFDLPYLAFFYNQKIILYKGTFEYNDAVLNLKNGLQAVLQDFWPLAGRLAKDDEGVFKVQFDDDDDQIQGVEVIEAVADVGLGVEDLLSAELDMDVFKDFLPFNSVLNLEGLRLPLMSVQLTKMRDGLVMGCAFNHAVLDGTSTWHFMLSWAEACNGLKTSQPKPIHDRSKVRDTRVKLDLSRPPAPTEAANGNGEAAAAAPPRHREKVFHFSESAVEQIKAKVDNKFSTFQSLSVHIWRAVTAARQLQPESPTVFTIFADCRKRIDPPMPESYFGNLIQAVFTGTAAGLLLAHPAEFGADVIKKAIESHDAKEIERRNKEWEEKPIIFQFKDAGMNCVAVGSSPRFKVYDVDFGFGAPESVRSGLNNRFDGMLYMYPGKSGGKSIDVEISLDAMAMEKLEKDKEFLMEEVN